VKPVDPLEVALLDDLCRGARLFASRDSISAFKTRFRYALEGAVLSRRILAGERGTCAGADNHLETGLAVRTENG
jgi:hypothetical protein